MRKRLHSALQLWGEGVQQYLEFLSWFQIPNAEVVTVQSLLKHVNNFNLARFSCRLACPASQPQALTVSPWGNDCAAGLHRIGPILRLDCAVTWGSNFSKSDACICIVLQLRTCDCIVRQLHLSMLGQTPE
jgi:hypothetical protein